MLLDFFSFSRRSKGPRRGTGKQCPELQLAFNAELLYGKMVFPVVRERNVEGCILIVRNVIRLPHPQWLALVQLFAFMRYLLDLWLRHRASMTCGAMTLQQIFAALPWRVCFLVPMERNRTGSPPPRRPQMQVHLRGAKRRETISPSPRTYSEGDNLTVPGTPHTGGSVTHRTPSK